MNGVDRLAVLCTRMYEHLAIVFADWQARLVNGILQEQLDRTMLEHLSCCNSD